MSRKAHCADCKKELIAPDPSVSCGTGYGYINSNSKLKRKICYACCGERDRADMIKTGKATLYLTELPKEEILAGHHNGARYEATNWPGSLRFCTGNKKISRHNIAGTRADVWFSGPDGNTWHGVQYGSNTQILHCKRLQTG